MPTDQDSTKTAGLSPQTAAARRRSAEERERLREESRARRRAREANGQGFAIEPDAAQITVRRLTDEHAEAPAAEAPAAEAPQSQAPPLDAPFSAPPQPDAPQPEPTQADAPAAEAQAPQAPPRRHAPTTPAAGRFAPIPARAPAPPPLAPPAPAEPQPAKSGPPPLRPRLRAQLPTAPRERAAALLGLASAIGVVVCLGATIGSGNLPGVGGGGGMQAETSARAVAPGGWIELSGSDAPGDAEVVLESRSEGGSWRTAGEASADGDGDFHIRGRVLEQPGRVALRARVPGVAAAAPVAVTVRPLRLASVGDINLGDVPGEAIAANGPRYPWETTGKALGGADIAFGNLECAVSTRGEPVPKDYNFRATPAALAGLRRHSGIDVLNLANNHVGDYGPEATLDTVRGVERLGMKAVGAGPDLRRALAPQVVERLGLKVAFVGFSEIAPIEFAAAKGQPGTAWAHPDKIASAVQAARKQADIVVATFHWGIERQTLETARQRELADVAVRAGAQVVLGAHPHTLQPVRRQGGAIVAYSLGNFVFGAQSPETSSTGILELALSADGVTKAHWRAAHISNGRPELERTAPRRLPLRDAVKMAAGVNL